MAFPLHPSRKALGPLLCVPSIAWRWAGAAVFPWEEAHIWGPLGLRAMHVSEPLPMKTLRFLEHSSFSQAWGSLAAPPLQLRKPC